MKNRLTFIILVSFVLAIFAMADISLNNDTQDNTITADNPEHCLCLNQDVKKKVKEVTVYITRTGKKYHQGSCRYLKKSKIKTTLKDACARGYTPCKVCKPPDCPSN